MISRRKAMTSGAAALAGGGVLLHQLQRLQAAEVPAPDKPREGTAAATGQEHVEQKPLAPGESGKDYTPVITPNGWTLPYKLVDGVKVFHLVAEEVDHGFAPGLKAKCWGYNGSTPGPTIEVVEGDRVRIYVTNRLPEPTSVHWHGILLPNGMDGVAGLNQKPIGPGETFKCEFTLRQHGTHMYHPHFDEMTQMGLGMMGLFVIHPRNPKTRPDRDFAIMLSEWKIEPGTSRPNPNEMTDFNLFTMNSKAFPGTAPLVAKLGQRVKVRLANLSAMDHHPIHLHGYQFEVTETDGGQVPESAQRPETTVLVEVGSTRSFEFVADEPGDWAMHCHMTHHVMNQMGHDIPNMVGVQPHGLDEKVRNLLPAYMTMGHTGMGEMAEMGMAVPKNSIPMLGGKGPFGLIDMGGMFTILKVRKELKSYDDPGWYEHPAGTVAAPTTAEELRRDGINVQAPTTRPAVGSYTCPMHPAVVAATPGNCPICGMKLVPRK
jgi:manganese oxidase